MGKYFGTDGVRGIAGADLTCELAMKLGRGVAAVLTDGSGRKPRILIGKDTRQSGDMLEAALTAGLCSVGADVEALGVLPTPAVAYLITKYKADAGVVISASHNPMEFNGIKVFASTGYKLPDEVEARIEAHIDNDCRDIPLATGAGVGQVSFRADGLRDYVDHLYEAIGGDLTGLNVCIDCANGAAAAVAQKLFPRLGARCSFLGVTPDGKNINDGVGSTHLEKLEKEVVAGGYDCGIAFDGDADRCLACDELGREIDGDKIIALLAMMMKEEGSLDAGTAVVTVMSNLGFIKFMDRQGIRTEKTAVGDRYVLENMRENGYAIGGEQSGHVIFRDFATTGDGQLTACQLLSLLRRREAKLSSLATLMQRYPQTMVNIKVSPEGKLAFYTDHKVKAAIDKASETLGKEGRVIVRPSGTEPLLRVMVEGRDEALIEKLAQDVAKVIEQELV